MARRAACTPSGCNLACSLARTEIELLRTLDFLVAISHPACMRLAATHVQARVKFLRDAFVVDKQLQRKVVDHDTNGPRRTHENFVIDASTSAFMSAT